MESDVEENSENTEVTLSRKFKSLISLTRPYISIGFSVPFLAGAAFSYLSLQGHSILPFQLLILPIIIGFFTGCGFFCLDSYFDVETDKLNPRQKTLPHTLDQNIISKRTVQITIIFCFSIGIFLAFFIDLFHVLLAVLGTVCGVLYSTPPFRFKGRVSLDITINVIAFGVVGSIFGWTIFSNIPNLNSIYGWFVLPICSILTFILVYPTPMIDYVPDKKANVRSTVVTIGLKNYTRIGLAFLIGFSVFMTFAELKIFYDFNTLSPYNFGFPFLIGLLIVGGVTLMPFIILVIRPTPKAAFYLTGFIAIIVLIGIFLALGVLYTL